MALRGIQNILPEMLTILPVSKTRVILLALRAIYSCISRKRAIQYYYHYYSYRLCVSSCYLLITIGSNYRLPLPHKIETIHFKVHSYRSFRNPLDNRYYLNQLPPFSWLFVYFQSLSSSFNSRIVLRSTLPLFLFTLQRVRPCVE